MTKRNIFPSTNEALIASVALAFILGLLFGLTAVNIKDSTMVAEELPGFARACHAETFFV